MVGGSRETVLSLILVGLSSDLVLFRQRLDSLAKVPLVTSELHAPLRRWVMTPAPLWEGVCLARPPVCPILGEIRLRPHCFGFRLWARHRVTCSVIAV